MLRTIATVNNTLFGSKQNEEIKEKASMEADTITLAEFREVLGRYPALIKTLGASKCKFSLSFLFLLRVSVCVPIPVFLLSLDLYCHYMRRLFYHGYMRYDFGCGEETDALMGYSDERRCFDVRGIGSLSLCRCAVAVFEEGRGKGFEFGGG